MWWSWYMCISQCTCERVYACIYPSGGKPGAAWPWTVQGQKFPVPIQTHTHRDPGLFSWVEEACLGHSCPRCSSHEHQAACQAMGWGALCPGLASAPHLLYLQKATHYGLGSRKHGLRGGWPHNGILEPQPTPTKGSWAHSD